MFHCIWRIHCSFIFSLLEERVIQINAESIDYSKVHLGNGTHTQLYQHTYLAVVASGSHWWRGRETERERVEGGREVAGVGPVVSRCPWCPPLAPPWLWNGGPDPFPISLYLPCRTNTLLSFLHSFIHTKYYYTTVKGLSYQQLRYIVSIHAFQEALQIFSSLVGCFDLWQTAPCSLSQPPTYLSLIL